VAGSRGRRGRRLVRESAARTRESGAEPQQGAGVGRLRRLLSSPVTILVAAVSALVTALVVGVGQELLPKENLADRLRTGDAIGVTVVADEPQAAVPGAVARERLDSPDSQRAVEAIRPPFPEAVGKVQLVPASSMQIYLQLTGKRSQPVDIIGMRVRVLRRQAPLTGTFLLGPGPQGSSPDVVLQATVDDPAPRLTEVTNGTAAQEPYFASHHVSLARGETVPFVLFAKATRSYSEWDIAIDYVADGKNAVAYVGRNGLVQGNRDSRPFAISALPPRIQDYGVVYTFPADGVGDSYYRRIDSDHYCSAVSTFYGAAYGDRKLHSWAC
jgi:hypothetical protein